MLHQNAHKSICHISLALHFPQTQPESLPKCEQIKECLFIIRHGYSEMTQAINFSDFSLIYFIEIS